MLKLTKSRTGPSVVFNKSTGVTLKLYGLSYISEDSYNFLSKEDLDKLSSQPRFQADGGQAKLDEYINKYHANYHIIKEESKKEIHDLIVKVRKEKIDSINELDEEFIVNLKLLYPILMGIYFNLNLNVKTPYLRKNSSKIDFLNGVFFHMFDNFKDNFKELFHFNKDDINDLKKRWGLKEDYIKIYLIDLFIIRYILPVNYLTAKSRINKKFISSVLQDLIKDDYLKYELRGKFNGYISSKSSDILLSINIGYDDLSVVVNPLLTMKNFNKGSDSQDLLINDFFRTRSLNWVKNYLSNLYKMFDLMEYEYIGKDIKDLPKLEFRDFIDNIDENEILEYCKTTKYLPFKEILPLSFDEDMSINNRGTRVQTYLQDDYTQLASFIILFKMIVNPIILYLDSHIVELEENSYEVAGLEIISLSKMFSVSEPFIKLKGYMDIVKNKATPADISKLIKTKSKAEDALSWYILATALFKNLIPSRLHLDSVKSSIVTTLYNASGGKATQMGQVDSTFREKKRNIGDDGFESYLQAQRVTSTKSEGGIVYDNLSLQTILGDKSSVLDNALQIIKDMKWNHIPNIEIVCRDIAPVMDKFDNITISEVQLEFIGDLLWVEVITRKSIDRLNLESIKAGLLAVASFMVVHDLINLSNLVISKEITNNNLVDAISSNTKGDPREITPEQVDKLNDMYSGVKRKIHLETPSTKVKEIINHKVVKLSNTFETFIPKKYRYDMTMNNVSINEDIRIDLAKLYILNYDIAYNNLNKGKINVN